MVKDTKFTHSSFNLYESLYLMKSGVQRLIDGTYAQIPSSYYVRFDTPKRNDGERNVAQFLLYSSSWEPLMSLTSATLFQLERKQEINVSEHTHLFKKKTLKQDVHSVVNIKTGFLALPFQPRLTCISIWAASLECLIDTMNPAGRSDGQRQINAFHLLLIWQRIQVTLISWPPSSGWSITKNINLVREKEKVK